MPNPFEAGFPGQAVGKGAAQVIENDFMPDDTPPVDVSDLLDTLPVEPTTGLPTIPVVDAGVAAGLSGLDFPERRAEALTELHKLSGAAALFGLRTLAESISKIDARIKAGDDASLADDLQELRIECEALGKRVLAELSTSGAA